MFSRILAAVGVGSLIGLLYLLYTTTPVEAGAIGVLGVFLLSYILLVVSLTFFIFFVHALLLRVFFGDMERRAPAQFSLKRSYYYASILALGPVIIVSLQSVGEYGVGELFLVLFLLALGCLYVSRQTT